jgi:hypothetical protein
MLRKEISGRIFAPYGSPDQPQERYLEAFARYKEKYQTYVKAGIWKSKEIQEDSQLFFHSQSISEYLTSVRRAFNDVFRNNNITYSGEWKNILEISAVARTFFEWWMKTAAGRCRDTLMIMNAKEPRKEMQKVIDELKAGIDDIKSYLTIVVPQVYDFANGNVSNRVEREMANAIIRPNTINNILEQEGLTTDFNGEYKYENYLNRLITDATTYASGPLFPTDDDTIERLDERAELLYNDIKLRS